jgi:L-threonylcarbamoyladenylate synthase
VTPPRLLRPGGVTLEALREILGEVAVDPAVVAPVPAGTRPKAPGMKYKHYAPAANVVIVAGTREHAAAYIRRHFVRPNAVLCFEEELPLYEDLNPTVYGFERDVESLSHNLFAALRTLDHAEIGTIFARCPEGGGLAMAVQNRLRKSAGFHVVDADTEQ